MWVLSIDAFAVLCMSEEYYLNNYPVLLTAAMAPKRPDVVKKQKRVKDILDEPAVQEKLEKKVAKKRARKASEKVLKAGGDDSKHDATAKPGKRQKKETVTFLAKPKSVSDKGTQTKSVRSGNTRK